MTPPGSKGAKGKPVPSCSVLTSWTLTLDMGPLSRLERLQLAALRLREIQNEAAAIYRSFPELDRRPRSVRGRRPSAVIQVADRQVRLKPDTTGRAIAWPAKLH
jgi:hypothetical protein